VPNTLFGRLLLSSLLVLSIFFGFMGYAINQVSHQNTLLNKQKQLQLQNYVLLSSAEIKDDIIRLPDELREHRFDEFESGLYGYVVNEQGEILWGSYSGHALTVDKTLLKAGTPEPGNAEFLETPHYYVYRYTVLWEVMTDKPELLTFSVLENTAPSLEKIRQFQKRLSLWFLGIGLTLIMLLMINLRWGTKPLRELALKLKQVETGDAERIEGKYPLELRGLANNLNDLIDTERKQRGRYHTTLADLAHSLKTPLAVIKTELETHHNTAEHQLLKEQTQRMEDIIKHQLQRAVVATPEKLVESHCLKNNVERITSALEKVYAEKAIKFNVSIDEGTIFRGDQRDLLEVIGNILDNACKACQHSINIIAKMNKLHTIIEVHDDGKGIPSYLRDILIKRGQRADTQHQGQGIGLDVARDIIESYQGELSIADSPIGGALIRIRFPF
jgi:two-component system, OmpR family, sensor histidine kinase PhoQ